MKMKLQMEATKQPLNWFRLDYNTRFPTAPYDYNMSLRMLDVRLVFFSDKETNRSCGFLSSSVFVSNTRTF